MKCAGCSKEMATEGEHAEALDCVVWLRGQVGEAFARGESQGFHEGTRAASDELLLLQADVERLRDERDAWRGLCEAGPQHVNAAIGAIVMFYRDDERRDIAAWLQHQGEQLTKRGDTEEAEAYLMAAYQVREGAKMIGPGAAALAARASQHKSDARRSDNEGKGNG